MSYIHTNLPVSIMVRLPHCQSRDSQDQETFLFLCVYVFLPVCVFVCGHHNLLNDDLKVITFVLLAVH